MALYCQQRRITNGRIFFNGKAYSRKELNRYDGRIFIIHFHPKYIDRDQTLVGGQVGDTFFYLPVVKRQTLNKKEEQRFL